MAYEHKEGKATLFKNDKGDNPNRPDYSGDGMYKGELVKIAMWVNINDKGERRMSLNIEPKQQRQEQPKQESPAFSTDFGEPSNQLDDEIPF